VRAYRQRLLALGIKQTFGIELLLELFEGQLQLPETEWFHDVDDELILAARLVYADPPLADHLQTIFGSKPQSTLLDAKQDRPNLAVFVFQGEIAVPGRRYAKIGNLALTQTTGSGLPTAV